MGWWTDVLRGRTRDWIFAPIGAQGTKVEPDTAYLSVFLRSMRIVDVRKGVSRYYGAVTSTCSLPHRGGPPAEFFVVTTPAALRDVDPKHASQVLTLNKRLVGPVPYRGGDVVLQVGLFSIGAGDLTSPYLEVLEAMATTAGVSFVGPALAFVPPLRRGLELLVGGGDPSILEIGLDTTLVAPVTGNYCLVGATRDSIDPEQLTLDGGGQLLHDGGAVTGFPYLVVGIDAGARRDDWPAIPGLGEAYTELRSDVQRGDLRRVEEGLAAFRRLVMTSPDLLAADGARLAQQVADEAKAALGTVATAAAGAPREMRELAALPLY